MWCGTLSLGQYGRGLLGLGLGIYGIGDTVSVVEFPEKNFCKNFCLASAVADRNDLMISRFMRIVSGPESGSVLPLDGYSGSAGGFVLG